MATAKYIQRYGNQLVIVHDDGTKIMALPTTVSDVWTVGKTSGGPPTPPDPTPGDFSWPYPLSEVTSEFGPRNGRFHEAIDFSGAHSGSGDDIPAIGAGVIRTSVGTGGSSGWGNYCIVDHGELSDGVVYYSLYGHMIAPPNFAVGEAVNKGDVLGRVGNTGNSFGAHLHLETHRGGLVWDTSNPSYTSSRTAINPRAFMAAFGDGQSIYG